MVENSATVAATAETGVRAVGEPPQIAHHLAESGPGQVLEGRVDGGAAKLDLNIERQRGEEEGAAGRLVSARVVGVQARALVAVEVLVHGLIPEHAHLKESLGRLGVVEGRHVPIDELFEEAFPEPSPRLAGARLRPEVRNEDVLAEIFRHHGAEDEQRGIVVQALGQEELVEVLKPLHSAGTIWVVGEGEGLELQLLDGLGGDRSAGRHSGGRNSEAGCRDERVVVSASGGSMSATVSHYRSGGSGSNCASIEAGDSCSSTSACSSGDSSSSAGGSSAGSTGTSCACCTASGCTDRADSGRGCGSGGDGSGVLWVREDGRQRCARRVDRWVGMLEVQQSRVSRIGVVGHDQRKVDGPADTDEGRADPRSDGRTSESARIGLRSRDGDEGNTWRSERVTHEQMQRGCHLDSDFSTGYSNRRHDAADQRFRKCPGRLPGPLPRTETRALEETLR